MQKIIFGTIEGGINGQGIEIKRKVIQEGKELLKTEKKYYNLNDFESHIANKKNLNVNPKKIIAN